MIRMLNIVLIVSVFAFTSTSASALTGPQENAVRSAKQYLKLQGFLPTMAFFWKFEIIQYFIEPHGK